MKLIRNTVFHYTSKESFIKMLDGIKNQQITFYASRAYELNDSTEQIYGLKEIWKWFPYFENILSIENKFKLSLNNLLSDSTGHNPSELCLNELRQCVKSPFVISFSNLKDFIPMWGMYGDKGKGVALGFQLQLEMIDSISEINDLTAFDGRPFSMKISYKHFHKKSPALIYTKFKYDNLHNTIKDFTYPEIIINKQMEFVKEIGLIPSLMLKHEAFSFEKESRLLHVVEDPRLIKYRKNKNSNNIPFIEVDIPLSLFSCIIIGPCCPPKYIYEIEQKINKVGLGNLNIIKSKVPFRDF